MLELERLHIRPRSLGERWRRRQEPQKRSRAAVEAPERLSSNRIRTPAAIEAAILEQIQHRHQSPPDGSRSSPAFRVAFALLIEMPELGSNAGQAAGLARPRPIAPAVRPMDGRERPSAGHALVRHPFNPDVRATYDRYRAAGKPAKLASTAGTMPTPYLRIPRPSKPLDRDGYSRSQILSSSFASERVQD